MSDGERTAAAAGVRPEDWANLVDLVQPRLGGRVLAVSDEFFASKDRLIDPAPPEFFPGRYDDHGKWMDGWETRRRRSGGHDWCVIALGLPGRVRGVDIDTSHFTGNFPAAASLEGCRVVGEPDPATEWAELLPTTELGGNRHHFRSIADERPWTHLRLHIYPDGGVARLRVWGEVDRIWSPRDAETVCDLAAIENGGRAVAWSDAHFGAPHSLLLPGRGRDMGDGWETRRRRGPGFDWVIVALGCAGVVEQIEVDTAHYKGNYPDRCAVSAVLTAEAAIQPLVAGSIGWRPLLPEQGLGADAQHRFRGELLPVGPVSHVRLDIFPDGGVSRLRILGKPDTGAR